MAAARCGKSNRLAVADNSPGQKSGAGLRVRNYAAQLIAERMTGVPAESFTKRRRCKWGLDHERRRPTHTRSTPTPYSSPSVSSPTDDRRRPGHPG